ncbi:amidase signature domain-containing protein [Haematococcus lacustris]
MSTMLVQLPEGVPDLGLASLRAAYSQGHSSPCALVRHLYSQWEAAASVFIHLRPLDDLLADASVLEQQAPEQRGVLWGSLLGVKDNVDVGGLPTTAACPAFTYSPSGSAPLVAAMQAAGALVVGKLNMDQFAAGLVGTRSPYGAPCTPFDARFISGGSSSGSGAAVGAGLLTAAVGTDTAGSGRVPAGLCGCVGLKPTLGSVSTLGVVPAAASLDCPTIFARSVPDGAAFMRVMQAAAPEQAADVWRRCPPAPQGVPEPCTSFRFAVPPAALTPWGGPGGPQAAGQAAEQFKAAALRLQQLGGQQVEIDWAPFCRTAAMLYGTSFVAERWAGIRDFIEKGAPAAAAAGGDALPADPSTAAVEGLTPGCKRAGQAAQHWLLADTRFMKVTRAILASAATFNAADVFSHQSELAALRAAAAAQLGKVEVLLVPTALAHFTTQEVLSEEEREEPVWSRNALLGRFTNFVNLLDMCGVAVPSGLLHLDADTAEQQAEAALAAGQLGAEEAAAVSARVQLLRASQQPQAVLPFGVTLLSRAWRDEWLWQVADAMHQASGLGCGPQGHGTTRPA